MGRARISKGRRGMRFNYLWESQKVSDHWEDQNMGGWIISIKMDFGEVGWGGMDWINLVKNGDHWMSLENTIMNLQIP
jgi:hypothetical protein